MEEEKNKPFLRDKLRQAAQEASEEAKEKGASQDMDGKVKIGLYIITGIGVVWASQYFFSALAGAIRSFKDLRKSIREK